MGRGPVAWAWVLMSPFRACLLLVLLWAAIYLPGLGNQEIRGEEWRRVLPARTMLNRGEWVVPEVGGQAYLRKPPLINWVTALSFGVTGLQNEWTARLPGALLVLAGALGMFAFLRGVLGMEAAWLGAVMFLGCAGVIEKGRLAELEVYHIVFTGLAFASWLAGFLGGMKRWAAWLWAGFFLGWGMLAKGPPHLLFFYGLVAGACWKTRRWRELGSLPHLAGMLVCIGMFALWAVPFMEAYGRRVGASGMEVLQAWNQQMASRATGESETSLGDWIARGPSALVLFLPWVLFLPLCWNQGAKKEGAHQGSRLSHGLQGAAWGALGGFALMVLLPSSSPRYVAPLFGPVAVMFGWLLKQVEWRENRRWFQGWRGALRVLSVMVGLAALVAVALVWDRYRITALMAAMLAAGLLVSAFRNHRWMGLTGGLACWTAVLLGAGVTTLGMFDSTREETVRGTALQIRDTLVAEDGPLLVYRLGPSPYPFYFPRDAVETRELPKAGVKSLLTTEKELERLGDKLERRFGRVVEQRMFESTWGESQRGERLVLLRFSGAAKS